MGLSLSATRCRCEECLQLAKDAGFDGIELNYDLENELSPRAGTAEIHAIRPARPSEIGIAISGVCSFLFWPYSLTSNDPEQARAGRWSWPADDRSRARRWAPRTCWSCPARCTFPGSTDYEPVPNDVCDQRAREAIGKLAAAGREGRACT